MILPRFRIVPNFRNLRDFIRFRNMWRRHGYMNGPERDHLPSRLKRHIFVKSK